VVMLQIGVEADAVLSRTQGCEKPEICEQPKRTVDRVEGDGRHVPLHHLVNRFRTGVLDARCDGTEDLKALVRELDARPLGDRLELLKPPLDLLLIHLHV
jgi:hypothetical protein